jgi:hypothetical protein
MDACVKPAIRAILKPKKNVLSAVSLKGILVVIQNYLTIMQYAYAVIKVISCRAALCVIGTGSL